MAPIDDDERGMDPTEMRSQVSVRVARAGDEIAVEIVRLPDDRRSRGRA